MRCFRPYKNILEGGDVGTKYVHSVMASRRTFCTIFCDYTFFFMDPKAQKFARVFRVFKSISAGGADGSIVGVNGLES